MSKLSERGARSERGSALWGTGGRGGDRSSVLWGKGGRGIVVACVAALALTAPLAAMADSGKKASGSPSALAGFVDPGLLNAKGQVDVIITSSAGLADANSKLTGLGVFQKDAKQLGLINGVEATVPAAQLKKLVGIPGINVTPNANVQLSGSSSTTVLPKSSQLWPYESGNADMWAGDTLLYAGKFPAIAIVDSGVQSRSDFGSRIVASVNLSTLDGNTSTDDQRGHGTFVAGIAAGAAPDLAGAAPGAPIVSIKVMDSNGQAKTSDVISACQWILDHKGQYNIKVANFSMHSSYSTNSYRDPLDQAVERLWFNGVTVVAAAGNYGTSATSPSGVLYSPGNDPFVITVGAVDLGGSSKAKDDAIAPWSAWGYTEDGFYKPDIAAPGRYMVGPIPAGSTIAQQKSGSLVGSDRIQLSGTSFAAPVVSGTVAQMLVRHPSWTPDQIKGALMRTARKVTVGNPKSAGLGELTASRAAAATFAPNPNLGLERFMKSAADGSGQVFDAMSWASAAKSDMSWNSMSWSSQSWSDMSWADQSWASMSWADMSWSSMSWADMSWADMSWADLSSEDAAEGDNLSGTDGYVATPDEVTAAADDPDHVDVDTIPTDLLPAPDPIATVDTTATTDTTVAATTDAVASTDPAATTDTTATTATTDPAATTDPVTSTTTVTSTDPVPVPAALLP
jgi:serine protease AprX